MAMASRFRVGFFSASFRGVCLSIQPVRRYHSLTDSYLCLRDACILQHILGYTMCYSATLYRVQKSAALDLAYAISTLDCSLLIIICIIP